MFDTLIVGAGISGLSLGQTLKKRGHVVHLLEKSRGVGGRCATRRIQGQPVDHGLPLLHGRSQPFLRELNALESSKTILGWPHLVRGEGVPCQPQAFASGGVRLAIAEGVTFFAKRLARGLDVELETKVERLEPMSDGFRLHTERGTREAQTVVFSCPVDQVLPFLSSLADVSRELLAVQELMRLASMVPCLTVIALYDEAPPLDFHLRLPGPQSPIHSLINDGSKRAPGAKSALVIQSHPQFARRFFDEPEEIWREELLGAAKAILGPWVGSPSACELQRWRHARVQPKSELSGPILLRFSSGARLGICGDAFHYAGGVEGAFLSGRVLAERLARDEATLIFDPGKEP
jgi:renalase